MIKSGIHWFALLMLVFVLFFVLGAGPCLGGRVEVKFYEDEVYDREVYVLDNGLVRLGVTDKIGGRILEFIHLKTGDNAAKIRLDNIDYTPDDAWVGADYGGITDAGTSGWPGPFWGVTYEIEQKEKRSGARSLLAKTESEGLGISREMTVYPDSTLLSIGMRQTNATAGPKEMTVRLHCELAIGELADDGDMLYYIDEDGELAEVEYIVGAEYERFKKITISDGWAALVDPKERSVLVRKFLPVDENHLLFWWVGSNPDPTTLGYKGPFYALDWFGMKGDSWGGSSEYTVESGESIKAYEEWFMLAGMDRVDFVEGHKAGSLNLDKARYGSSDTVVMTARLGGAYDTKSHKAELIISEGGNVLDEMSCMIPGSEAGEVGSCEDSWGFDNLRDGKYTAVMQVYDNDGVLIGDAERSFAVAGELVSKASKAKVMFERELEEVLKIASRSGDINRLEVETEVEVLGLRKENIQRLYDNGKYEDVLEKTSKALDEIDALMVMMRD
jgi:hypothetical protein